MVIGSAATRKGGGLPWKPVVAAASGFQAIFPKSMIFIIVKSCGGGLEGTAPHLY